MDLILQDNLKHQLTPVMSIADIVSNTPLLEPQEAHRNPTLQTVLSSDAIATAWEQNHVYNKMRHYVTSPNTYCTKEKDLPSYQMLDVKMETGTGKTYVYTQTMFELHKRFGFNKFIVAVPSLPIKAGASSFLDDPYVMHHFADACGYGAKIELCMLEAQKKKKKGRQNFPPAVGRFFYGTKYDKNKIYVLLLNTQLLTGSSKLLTRDDYDQMVGDFHVPVDAISDTKPVLIIDEPHRMKRDSDTFKNLIGLLHPQLVIRYGATYPKVTVGAGKQKIKEPDYINLVYDLNACEAFNQVLIKGVAKETPKLSNDSNNDKRLVVVSIDKSAKTASVRLEKEDGHKEFSLNDIGYDLGQIDADLMGISFSGISKDGNLCLSNGIELHEKDAVFTDLYSTSYQEEMIKLALHRHFETERQNFERKPTRIKTLALFFIDNIESYRGSEDETGKKEGWLKVRFKQLLKEQVETELQREGSKEYKKYLQATLDNLDGACAGYFARDNQDSDEGIEEEVRLILHGKKELLSFEDGKGKPNVCRFLFSKWTLKEGWDNPNVFTICKLRSSGSEISKLQEVGRGLRLPVDEVGNRIQDGSFLLNYIVDFTEKKFASQLVAEINGFIQDEETQEIILNDEALTKAAEARKTQMIMLFAELLMKGYVDQNKKVFPDKLDEFVSEYPEFSAVSSERIQDRDKQHKPVKIRNVQFQLLRDLWHQLNHKYILYFDGQIESQLQKDLPRLILEHNAFGVQVVSTDRSRIAISGTHAVTVNESGYNFNSTGRHIPYNEFIKRVSRKTDLPISVIHQSICQAVDGGLQLDNTQFNEGSLTRLIGIVNDWKCTNLQGLVHYKKTQYLTQETKLTNADGSIRDEVVQGDIGCKYDDRTPIQKYLYDTIYYDSDIELQNITTDIESVIVYGKIPRKSICIPTVASSNYSPDFMYVVKRNDGSETLNIVIESKGYDSNSGLSLDEATKIACAEQLYKQMAEEGINVVFKKQLNNTQMMDIINGLLK